MTDTTTPSKRDLERALRGAGLSARQAKRVLAAGYRALGSVDPDVNLAELADRAEALAHELRFGCTPPGDSVKDMSTPSTVRDVQAAGALEQEALTDASAGRAA